MLGCNVLSREKTEKPGKWREREKIKGMKVVEREGASSPVWMWALVLQMGVQLCMNEQEVRHLVHQQFPRDLRKRGVHSPLS